MADKFDGLGFEEEKDEFADLGFSAESELGFEEEQVDEPSQGQAILEGVTRGATFGLSDEIAGASEAAGRALGLEGVGGPITDIGLSEGGPTLDLDAIKQGYVEGREAQRGREAASEEEFPKTAFAADMAGGLITGGAGVKALGKVPQLKGMLDKFRGLTKAKQAMSAGAGAGALESAGRSEEELGSLDFGKDVLAGTVLGGATGGLFSKATDKLSRKGLKATQHGLKEDANIQAMKSLGAGKKDFQREIESEVKSKVFGQPYKAKGTGQFALDEGIVDPLSRPKESYKKVLELKKKTSQGYEDELNKFENVINMSEKQADDVADTTFRTMDEKITQELGSNDLITKEMRESLNMDRADLQSELSVALQGSNPIKELQDLYTRYNKVFFSNAKTQSPTSEARKILRNEIKSMQRQLVDTVDSESAQNFKKLDKDYTNILDLEGITESAAGGEPLKEVGLGDIVKGATAKFLGIPVLGEATVAASVASKKILGKDVSDVASGISAIHKNKMADKAGRLADSPMGSAFQKLSDNPVEAAVAAVTTAAPAVDEVKTSKPQIRDAGAMSLAKDATPEQLQTKASEIRNQYGRTGEHLALQIEKMESKDANGRQAIMFSILQNNAYKKMLGVDDVQSGAK